MKRDVQSYERRVEPLAGNWRTYRWDVGVFDAAGRDLTPTVEGIIRTPEHVLMVTLSGAARHLEVRSECGHRFSGPDRAGMVSFVPANCERRLAMRDVASQWASISLSPLLFREEAALDGAMIQHAFSNVEDRLVAAVIGEMAALSVRDEALDPVYCEAMSHALAHHLVARYGKKRSTEARRDWKIAPSTLRRITDHVEANLDGILRISALADLAGLSEGYFHRAFRATTGQTPLQFINERRVLRAIELIRSSDMSIAAVALRVGFASPTHLANIFRRTKGYSPSMLRRS